ncbi:RND transporter [Candidatus Defluviicoccus seviourii]|uniref:RND transporter n=1 Tax=Candidatus Defluviicoccus seviourii TaxID=2565273 RepID=A0A564WB38_9PROT|nr:RND transporter [Candidatus Defluviicoccus seviourii]
MVGQFTAGSVSRNARILPTRWAMIGRAAAMSALLAGCTAVGPDYQPPQTAMPDQWQQDLVRGLPAGQVDLRSWWTSFNDPLLTELITTANSDNLGVKEAVARILEARARVGIASGEQLPGVDAGGEITRDRLSKGVAEGFDQSRQRTSTLYNTGLDASWELDLWGRISRSVESADASYQAVLEDYRDVVISLSAQVARTYVEIRTLQARIAAAQANAGTQRKTLKLVRDRKATGLASDLEVAQAELNLATTESLVPALQAALQRSIHALGVLTGRRPQALYPRFAASAPIPQPAAAITAGAPADLLRRRPDIRAAERQLAAQTAQIGVATADLYPRFTLSGFLALQKFGARNFFESGNIAYQFGPSMVWNVFDGGRIRSNIKAQDALTEQALLRYEQAVLRALQEVEDALVDYAREIERRDLLARSVTAARRSVQLVQNLYVTGLTDFQNVQDQERSLFQQEDALAQSAGLVTQNLIRIYRALGGGWSPEPDKKRQPSKLPPSSQTVVARAPLPTAVVPRPAPAPRRKP